MKFSLSMECVHGRAYIERSFLINSANIDNKPPAIEFYLLGILNIYRFIIESVRLKSENNYITSVYSDKVAIDGILKAQNIDSGDAPERLREIIMKKDIAMTDSMKGEYAVKTYLDRASAFAAQRKSSEITARDLLLAIYERPTPIISKAFRLSRLKVLKNSESEADDDDCDEETEFYYNSNDDDDDDDDEYEDECCTAGSESLPERVNRICVMQKELSEIVIGQSHAVDAFAKGLFAAEEMSVRDKSRLVPAAVFTFAGPPGVGKSLLAKNAAKLLGRPFKQFDMSEYSGYNSHEGLIGFDYTYKGSAPGLLTSFVRDNPRCVLIFDEIEKANKKVIQLFLQILGDGVLTDRYIETQKLAAANGGLKEDNSDEERTEMIEELEENVSFKDAIIIFTTNVGRSLYDFESAENIAEVSQKTLLKALKTEINPETREPFFSSAIISRIATGYPILFNHLEPHHLLSIGGDELKRLTDLYNEDGMNIEADENIQMALLFAEGGACDARTFVARIKNFLTEQILKAYSMSADVSAQFNSVRFRADFRSLPDDLKKLIGGGSISGKKVAANTQGCVDKAARFLSAQHKILLFKNEVEYDNENNKITITACGFKLVRNVDPNDTHDIVAETEIPKTRFSDVIGASAAISELEYFVSFLKDPNKFTSEKSMKPPKGVLLYGLPGTGKTLLAKAMAGESGAAFIPVVGSELAGKYIGSGAEAVRTLFKKARKYAPSVIFIDEIDAIAKKRGFDGSSNAEESTLNQLLGEIDGFKTDPKRPVFVLAATNADPDKDLDPALMRRFERKLLLELPDVKEREVFLTTAFKNIKNQSASLKSKVTQIATRSVGMSFCDLDSVVQLALRTADKERRKLSSEILEQSYETIMHGEFRGKKNDDELRRVARHEAGHAFLYHHFFGIPPVYVTIVSRGHKGGYMQRASSEFNNAMDTKKELLSKVRMFLGGRATEIAYYGEENGLTTGASADLKIATVFIRDMIVSYGMDEQFGLSYMSEKAAEASRELRKRINEILSEEMKLCVELVRSNKDTIDRIVKALLEKNKLYDFEISELLTGVKPTEKQVVNQ